MSALPLTPPAVAPLLQFSCGHCGVVLSVPAALAGVKGPCPSCQQLIVAPGLALPQARVPVADAAPVAPRPRLPRPVSLPPPAPATEERRSTLRRHTSTAAEKTGGSERSGGTGKSDKSGRSGRSERSERKRDDDDAAPLPTGSDTLRPRLWTSAAVGAVIGGGLVFAGLSATRLRRDLSPAPLSPTTTQKPESDDDAIAALAEQRKESARELKSLLAAQQAVWRFFAAASAEEAAPLVSDAAAQPLPASGLPTPLQGITLRSKRRLPAQGGIASQWAVTTTRFGELVIEVSDATGQPRLNWAKLAPQLGASTTPPDRRTAATP